MVGGGPAGMEAARTLAARGHDISLWERRGLGGQLAVAGVPPYKSEITQLSKCLVRQVQRSGVNILRGSEATPESIEEMSPDVVVLATGSRPIMPEIPGIEKAKVALALDILEGKAEVGERVVIIGGELVGCETAEYLANMGKTVTVLRRSAHMADKMNPDMRMMLVDRLERMGVRLVPNVQYMLATDTGIRIHVRGGITSMAEIAADAMKNVAADTFVIAAGSIPDIDLAEALKGKKGLKVYSIGDCVEPRRIQEAIREGWKTALEI